ncbi:hypothetical protein, partial [Gemmiger sp. An120]|uniref:hypothetical protein n=1 Tax=Gemmiger sp. An120 TaxID=1965549 RepID=UPI0019D17415
PPVADAASRSGLGSGAERCERVVTRDVSATRRNRMSPWKRTKQKATQIGWLFVWCCFPHGKLIVSRGAASPFALRAPVQLAGTLGLTDLPPEGRS